MKLTLIINNSGVYVDRGRGRPVRISDTFDSVIIRKIAGQFPPLPFKQQTVNDYLENGGAVTQCHTKGELHRMEISRRREEAATIDLEDLGIKDVVQFMEDLGI